jgi:hypothetical protein
MFVMLTPKRYRLSLLARRTQHMLFGLLAGLALTLFVAQLFVMNYLSMSGYRLTIELTERSTLADKHEKLDAAIAKAQTQEFVYKAGQREQLVVKDNQRFVVVPNRYTAQQGTDPRVAN